MGHSYTDLVFEYFVFCGDSYLPSTLKSLVEFEYSDVMRLLRDKVCPVCGRVFKSRSALLKHLKKNSSCKFSLISLASEIVSKWQEERRKVELKV